MQQVHGRRAPSGRPVRRHGLHVLQGGHVRPEREVLEHHSEITPLRRRPGALGRVIHDLATQMDPAGVGALKACDQAEERGLARTGSPDQDDDLAGVQAEVDGVEHAGLAEALVHLVQDEQGRGHAGPSARPGLASHLGSSRAPARVTNQASVQPGRRPSAVMRERSGPVERRTSVTLTPVRRVKACGSVSV